MELGGKIQQLSSVTVNVVNNIWQQELNELLVKLQLNKFNLVVVGMFKRGKSSIINALMDKDIAPVAVTPVTAIVTIFEYDDQCSAEVYFENGNIGKIDIRDISEFVSEEKNPDNQKKVKLVKVYDNAELLKTTSLVDTPGLGSAFEHNTATTLSFVPKIDAALFILSTDIPISKIDLELLDSLKQTVPEILFVQNKADLAPAPDLQKMMEHNKKILASKLNVQISDIDLSIISAKEISVPGNNIQQLRERIQKFLSSEKELLLQQNVFRRLKSIIVQIELELKLRIDTWTMPASELENKQQQFQSSLFLMKSQKEEFESVILGKIKKLRDEIDEQINDVARKLERQIEQKSEVILSGKMDFPGKAGLKDFKDKTEKHMIEQFDRVKTAMEILTKTHFKELLKDYSSRSQSFLNEMASNLQSLMGINFGVIADTFDLDVYSSFYLTLDSGAASISFQKPLLYHLLPASVWRREIYKRFQKHFKEIIIRNASSVIYDLQYKIQESFRKFNYDLNNRLQQLVNTIESILDETLNEKNKAFIETEKKTEPLKQALEEVQRIGADANEVNKYETEQVI